MGLIFFPSHNNFFFLQGHFRSSVSIIICSVSYCRQSCLQPLSSEGEIQSHCGILPKSLPTKMSLFCPEQGRCQAEVALQGSGTSWVLRPAQHRVAAWELTGRSMLFLQGETLAGLFQSSHCCTAESNHCYLFFKTRLSSLLLDDIFIL